ncbi:MAG: hypothetical protein PHN45_07190 [Methylococcales bacterium]|nr:hypothetical protein [Methylococcales bacterium]MDD5754520.1 hypothetical protein [Methylococcales bacterium]
MSVYTINSSPTGYQVLKVANANMPVQTDNNVDNNVSPEPSSVSSNSESFVQSVLQSLQGLGLNTSDVGTGASMDGNAPSSNATEALQVFVQDLYKALQDGGQSVSTNAANTPSAESGTVTSSVEIADNIASTGNSTVPPTKISGGTNFKYTVDFSQADLGDNLANVEANVKTALDNIGQYISSKVVFDLKVLTETADPNKLAETNSSLLTSTSSQNGANADTTFVTDSIHGVNFYPDVPDATLRINLASLDQMSFSGSPTPDKYDLTSILTHEILHGLAFTGNLGGNATAALTTTYDSLVTTPDTIPTFVGHHAETANAGNPVPLSPSSSGAGSAYYHVAIPNDLMAESIGKGEVRKISALDIAMLEDMGITVTGASPAPSKVQIAYSNPTTNLQNLMSSLNNDSGKNSVLQTDFSNLVDSLGGTTPSPQVNLQDFLTQLSVNTTNGDLLQKDSGSFFSATA